MLWSYAAEGIRPKGCEVVTEFRDVRDGKNVIIFGPAAKIQVAPIFDAAFDFSDNLRLDIAKLGCVNFVSWSQRNKFWVGGGRGAFEITRKRCAGNVPTGADGHVSSRGGTAVVYGNRKIPFSDLPSFRTQHAVDIYRSRKCYEGPLHRDQGFFVDAVGFYHRFLLASEWDCSGARFCAAVLPLCFLGWFFNEP
jgi:hypothetical protein